jgi:hypothetical protein
LVAAASPTIAHTVAMVVFWAIWKSRNKMVFDTTRILPRTVNRSISEHVKLWTYRTLRKLDTELIKS